jgi:hypothetical protein
MRYISTYDEFTEVSFQLDEYLRLYKTEVDLFGSYSNKALDLERKMIALEDLLERSSKQKARQRIGIKLVENNVEKENSVMGNERK